MLDFVLAIRHTFKTFGDFEKISNENEHYECTRLRLTYCLSGQARSELQIITLISLVPKLNITRSVHLINQKSNIK